MMNKITIEMEELYGELMRKSAIEMGQQGKLPQVGLHQQQNQNRKNKQETAYQIIKNHGIINAKQLAEKMGLKSKEHARNFIQRLVREGKVKKIMNPVSYCHPYSGYTAVN